MDYTDLKFKESWYTCIKTFWKVFKGQIKMAIEEKAPNIC